MMRSETVAPPASVAPPQSCRRCPHRHHHRHHRCCHACDVGPLCSPGESSADHPHHLASSAASGDRPPSRGLDRSSSSAPRTQQSPHLTPHPGTLCLRPRQSCQSRRTPLPDHRFAPRTRRRAARTDCHAGCGALRNHHSARRTDPDFAPSSAHRHAPGTHYPPHRMDHHFAPCSYCCCCGRCWCCCCPCRCRCCCCCCCCFRC
mmetsp:Transcript_72586/g.130692  ORF Transcript_72586/g.130692 Transcript_72586/m.130692 type:complete len:204 (+) Transcript_72586:174-785(+)